MIFGPRTCNQLSMHCCTQKPFCFVHEACSLRLWSCIQRLAISPCNVHTPRLTELSVAALFLNGCIYLCAALFGVRVPVPVPPCSVSLQLVPFFFTTWEHYYTDELILPVVNGPSEGVGRPD